MPRRLEESKRVPWGWFALIFCAAVAAYLPALRGGFIWNDRDYVTQPQLRSWAGLGRIWFEVGATQQYYPLLHTAFWIEHLLWGDSAFGYHLLNVLLHATAACLFAMVLRQLMNLSQRPKPSVAGQANGLEPGQRLGLQRTGPPPGFEWLAALIFAVHPVCVESVAWISEEKNTLSTVFYLLAALFYLRLEEKRHALEVERVVPNALSGAARGPARWGQRAPPHDYLLATAFFILALLSKSVTATLPATLLIVLWWRRGRLEWRRDVVPLLPWFALGAAGGLFTAWVEHSVIGAQGSDFDLSLLARGLVAGRTVWFYLSKLFWPSNLIFIYPRWEVDPQAAWQFLFPVGVLAALGALWAWRRRLRAQLAVALIFVGTLFPTLGFLNVYAFVFSFVADHFQYLASLGVIGLVAAGWAMMGEERNDGAEGARISSAPRAGVGPPSPAGPTVAEAVAGKRGLRRPSKQMKKQGVRLKKLWFSAENHNFFNLTPCFFICLLGVLTWRQCRMYRDSETLYRAILARNPDCWMAHDNLGTLLRQSGRIGEAVFHYEQALWLKPGFAEGHNNLGVALIDSGRKQEAIGQLEKAVRLRPDFPEAEDNLGSALASSGRIPEALAIFERLIRRRPDLAEAHTNFGVALAQADRMPEAAAQCREALRLDPRSAEARRTLGVILQAMGPGRPVQP